MKELNEKQKLVLAVIVEAGGTVIPQAGGWWSDKDGNRLSIGINSNDARAWVSCRDVFSLFNRGALQIIPESGNETHWAYEVTQQQENS